MTDDFFRFWLPVGVAIISLILNLVQFFGNKKVRNKISIWAKDAKGVISSIIGIQKNIKIKKISSLDDVMTNMDTLANFANSMFVSMEEELGRKKREIKMKKKKVKKNNELDLNL
jgi:hypothetical protein